MVVKGILDTGRNRGVMPDFCLLDIYLSLLLPELSRLQRKALLDFSKFKGSLGTAAGVKACLEYLDNVSLVLEKLYVYASMKHHEALSRGSERFRAP